MLRAFSFGSGDCQPLLTLSGLNRHA